MARTLVTLAVLVVAVTTLTASPPPSRATAFAGTPGDPLVQCWSDPFPASRLTQPMHSERGRGPAAAGLRRVLRGRSVMTGGPYPQTGWWLMPDAKAGPDSTSLTYGRPWPHHRGATPKGFDLLNIGRSRGRWVWEGEESCDVERVFTGLPKGLYLADDRGWDVATKLTPTTTSLTLWVDISGYCADARYDHTDVEVTAKRVTLYVYLQPAPPVHLPKNTVCAGVGHSVKVVVPLPGPLGDRHVFNPDTYPATRVIPKPGLYERRR
jgi:hypothetical protein